MCGDVQSESVNYVLDRSPALCGHEQAETCGWGEQSVNVCRDLCFCALAKGADVLLTLLSI